MTKNDPFVEAHKLMVIIAAKHHEAKKDNHDTTIFACADTEKNSAVIAFPGTEQDLIEVKDYIKKNIVTKN